MTKLADVLGQAKVDSLRAAINTTFEIPYLREATKEDKLGEDLRWIQFHTDYLESVKDTFRISLQRLERGKKYLHLHTPLSVRLFIENHYQETRPHNFRGYHVNATLLSIPSIVFEYEPGTLKSHDQSLVVSSLIPPSENAHVIGGVQYTPLRDLADLFETVGAYSNPLVETFDMASRYGLVRDVRPWKNGNSWVFPKLAQNVRIGDRAFCVVPLLPEGFHAYVREMAHNGKFDSKYWSVLA